MPDSHEPTLATLRRDRLLIWLWVPGGVVVIAALMQAWTLLASVEPPRYAVRVLCVLWIVSVLMMIWRHSSRPCPDCGYRYLRAFPWMSLKKVRCPACGYELS